MRNPNWRPKHAPVVDRFRMSDLLVFAVENKASLPAPLRD